MDNPVKTTDVDVAALSPFTLGASVAVELIEGEDGQVELETRIRTRASEEPSGKLPKAAAYYVPATAPPALWEYRCDTCRFYEATSDDAGLCDVVGREDDALGGETVHSRAWCALWLPKEDREPFDWLRDRLHPTE